MGKKRIPTELEKLEQKIDQNKEMVFYQDIIVAIGLDTQALVVKAADIRTKLTMSILAAERKTP